MGRGRSGQNQAAVAPLLPEHSRWERDRAVPANTGAFKAPHRCIKDRFLLLCKPSPVYWLSRTESYIIFIQPCHMTCVAKQTLFLACKRVKQKDMSCSHILLEQISVLWQTLKFHCQYFFGVTDDARQLCAVLGALSSWSCQLAGELQAHAGTALQATTVNEWQPVLSAEFEVVKLFTSTVVRNINHWLAR